MKELDINLVVSPARSKTRKVIGIITMFIAISWLAANVLYKDPLSLFDIVYSAFFTLYGIVFILDGSGISIRSWFGESYIKINSEGLYIKKGVFSKGWDILWKEIVQVEIAVISIKFTLAGNVHRELDYDDLEFGHIQQIKQSIIAYSEEKGINVIKPFK